MTRLRFIIICYCALMVSLVVIVAGNWRDRHPAPPPVVEPKPKQEIKTPVVEPGHLRIYNSTTSPVGAMVYLPGRGVICPRLPPSFGIICIEVAAGKDIDLVMQPKEAR